MSSLETPPSEQTNKAAYVLPSNSSDHERLDAQSEGLVAMMSNKPFTAPIVGSPSFRKALDIGTGTGSMAKRLARENSNSKVIGVDLSADFGTEGKPDNVEFQSGEIHKLVNDRIPGFDLESFSYIFSRMLIFGIPDWPGYLRLAHSLLEPGGWVEIQEPALVFYDAEENVVSSDWLWINEMAPELRQRGLDPFVGPKLVGLLEKCGFEDVRVKEYYWTLSTTPWEAHPESDLIGKYSVEVLRPQIRKLTGSIFDGSAKSSEEIDAIFKSVIQTLDMPKGGHYKFYVVCGRKPAA